MTTKSVSEDVTIRPKISNETNALAYHTPGSTYELNYNTLSTITPILFRFEFKNISSKARNKAVRFRRLQCVNRH